jgi:hypothetical protein
VALDGDPVEGGGPNDLISGEARPQASTDNVGEAEFLAWTDCKPLVDRGHIPQGLYTSPRQSGLRATGPVCMEHFAQVPDATLDEAADGFLAQRRAPDSG